MTLLLACLYRDLDGYSRYYREDPLMDPSVQTRCWEHTCLGLVQVIPRSSRPSPLAHPQRTVRCAVPGTSTTRRRQELFLMAEMGHAEGRSPGHLVGGLMR